MDRHTRLRLAACGLALLTSGMGCKSLLHRHEVPPEPAAARDQAPAQFGSDPQTLRLTEGPPKPTGPISSAAGNYGPQGTNSTATPNSGAPASSAVGTVDPFAQQAGPSAGALATPPAGDVGSMNLEGGPR